MSMKPESVTFSPTEPESELKRPKSEAELGSEQKPETYYDHRISKEFHDKLNLYECDESEYFRSVIRSMFSYNPNKFVDDDDDDNMGVGFDQICREEMRSAKINREEDKQEMRLIEEEMEIERRAAESSVEFASSNIKFKL